MKNTEAYRRTYEEWSTVMNVIRKLLRFSRRSLRSNHTDKIKKPIFIVQGGNDPRVPHTESIQMKEKIKQNGGTVWFLEASDEGHGFRKKNNVDFQFYATIAFVKQFLLN